jgi:hypothetical protein
MLDENYINQIRKKVQDFLYDEKFIVPIESILNIEEKGEKATLKNVEIFDIPTAKHTISWVIDLEKENQIYSAPQGFKKGEKALIILDNKRLHCFMFELKSKTLDLYQIQQKFENTAERISFLLSIYNFDSPEYSDITFYFKGIVCYIDGATIKIPTEQLKTERFYKIFKGEEPIKRMNFSNGILGQYTMDIDFLKASKNSVRIPFSKIYAKTIRNSGLKWQFA